MAPSPPILVLNLQVVQYVNVSGLAVLVYDYWVTLPSEVRLMWGTRWGITRIAFTLSRYMPFAGVIMTCYAAVKNRTGENCIPFGKVSNGIHYVCIISSEGLLILRTYAIWECSRKLLISLLLFAGATGAAAAVVPHIHLQVTAQNTVNPGGCTFETNKNTVLQYVPLAFYEIVLLFLTKLRHDRRSSSLVVNVLTRDNMTYISCIILVTVLNVIIGFAAPAQDIEMLNSTQIVIHSVVASRILFNLRECEKCENERTFMSALAEFQDAHHPSFPLIEEPSQSSTSDSAESSLETQRQGRISNATNGCYSEPNLSSPPAVTVPGKDNVC